MRCNARVKHFDREARPACVRSRPNGAARAHRQRQSARLQMVAATESKARADVVVMSDEDTFTSVKVKSRSGGGDMLMVLSGVFGMFDISVLEASISSGAAGELYDVFHVSTADSKPVCLRRSLPPHLAPLYLCARQARHDRSSLLALAMAAVRWHLVMVGHACRSRRTSGRGCRSRSSVSCRRRRAPTSRQSTAWPPPPR